MRILTHIKRGTAVLIALSVMLMYTGVFADGEFNIFFDDTKKILSVDGAVSYDTAAYLKDYVIQVFKPGMNEADLEDLTGNDVLSALDYTKQVKPDKNGESFVSFTADKSPGFHTVRFILADGEVINSSYVNTDGKADAILSAVNNAEDAEGIKTAIRENEDVFNKGFRAYERIGEVKESSQALNVIYNNMLKGQAYESADKAVREYRLNVILRLVEYGDMAEDVRKVIDNYPSEIGIGDLTAYTNTYKKLSYVTQSVVCSELLNKKYANKEEFINVFCEASVLCAVNYAKNWNNVKEIVDNNIEYLDGINYADYEKLYKKGLSSEVDKIIVSKKYPSINEFVKAFNEAVKTVTEKKSDKSDSSSGGGGGKTYGIGGFESKPEDPKQPEVNPDTQPFTDLAGFEWATEAINELYKMGVVNGKGNGLFAPYDNVKREEFVKMLVNALNIDAEAEDNGFSDADKNEWYYIYLSKAKVAGIVKGNDNGEFGIGQNITREDMATMAYRAYSIAAGDMQRLSDNVFADDKDISDYAKDSVYLLKDNGIINGVGENMFLPKNTANRGEAAKIIYSLIKFSGKGV